MPGILNLCCISNYRDVLFVSDFDITVVIPSLTQSALNHPFVIMIRHTTDAIKFPCYAL